ncbi:MAG: SLC13 family permease [Vicinamibacterales bacterium]
MQTATPEHQDTSALRARHASEGGSAPYSARQIVGWIVGPTILLLTLLLPPPHGLSIQGWRTVGAAGLMAVFWMAESIPIPVTALLPLALFPLLGLGDIRQSAAPFANPIIYLFYGGFVLALAMQRWGLHRRVAISLLSRVGTRPAAIVGGFLLASAVTSMWVSNTATALMMLPIASSVIQLLPRNNASTVDAPFGTAVALSVAYGATTGGMATLIGTPPNALLAGYVSDVYGFEIGFGRWMLLGVPMMLIALPAVHLVLTRIMFRLPKGELPGMRAMLEAERAKLGPLNRGEFVVAMVFTLTAVAWVLQPVIAQRLPMLSDTTIAMMGAIALFMIPVSGRRVEFVMSWETARDIPWGVLLLFGGGLSLADNIERHGVSRFLGDLAGGMIGVPVLLVLCVVCFGILMLTELTSNTATAATFLPITAALAITLGQNPLLFVIPTALAASCSYMLPVGTPPNAIVYGSGLVTLPQMARAGVLLNILLVPILVGLVLALGPVVFGIHIDTVPGWALVTQGGHR